MWVLYLCGIKFSWE